MTDAEIVSDKKRQITWSNYLILLPAAVVVVLSILAIDTIAVRFLALLAILGTGLIWCTVSLLKVPWLRTWKSFAASIALSVSVLTICLPVRIAAAVSSPALNRLADRIEAGEKIDTPVWAGVFYVRKVQNWNGMPCLWTFPGGSGSDGLARPFDGVAEDKFSEWSIYPLHGNWFVIAED